MPFLNIAELFTSIQGESTHAGRRCFFIRLAGCNLHCPYCDTQYAQGPDSGRDLGLEELLAEARQAGVALVEITGGEPLLQPKVIVLCRELLKEKYTVLCETNGSLPIATLPAGVIRILDCKTPSSGGAEKMDLANFAALTPADEVKFVIADENDYRYAAAILSEHKLTDRTGNILFSPAWGALPPAQLAAWILRDRLPVRLQLQLHKIIWGPETRGV